MLQQRQTPPGPAICTRTHCFTIHIWCCALGATPGEESACISRRSGCWYEEAGTTAAVRLGLIIGGQLTGDAPCAGSRPTPGTSPRWCAWRIGAGRARSRWAAATPSCSGTSQSSCALQSLIIHHCPQHWCLCRLGALPDPADQGLLPWNTWAGRATAHVHSASLKQADYSCSTGNRAPYRYTLRGLPQLPESTCVDHKVQAAHKGRGRADHLVMHPRSWLRRRGDAPAALVNGTEGGASFILCPVNGHPP